MSEAAGCILRIATEEWVDHVFDMAIYYTSMRGKLKRGQTVIFVCNTEMGDAFAGYGVVDCISELGDLSEEDKSECEEGGWKRAVQFKYVRRFEKPLPVRATFLKSTKFRGRFLHGLRLDRQQLENIVSKNEQDESTKSLNTHQL